MYPVNTLKWHRDQQQEVTLLGTGILGGASDVCRGVHTGMQYCNYAYTHTCRFLVASVSNSICFTAWSK